MIKLSIIIPFYNAQNYIEQCLSSVCEQDVPVDCYEVIAVDDASTDNSSSIVLRLQSDYGNLRLISLKNNKKQGGARNEGLRAAKGEWVWFVDADDYIQPKMLKQLLGHCADDLDIIHFDYLIDNGDMVVHSENNDYQSVILPGDKFFNYSQHHWWTTCINVWQRIMRRSFLFDKGIVFAEYVQFEDVDYSFKCFARAKLVKHVTVVPYVYRYVSDSTSRMKYSEKTFFYWYSLVLRCIDLHRNEGMGKETDACVVSYIRYQMSEVIELYNELTPIEQKNVSKGLRFVWVVKVLPYISCKKTVCLIKVYFNRHF